jgi:hypothetical protein
VSAAWAFRSKARIAAAALDAALVTTDIVRKGSASFRGPQE